MLLKHPLFWKEWKSAKWWSLLIAGIFVLMFLAINSSLQDVQEIIKDMPVIDGKMTDFRYMSYYLQEPIFIRCFQEQLFNIALALLPIVIVISTILFHSDRKESIGAFISSLPFTKREQFGVKWTVGMLVITIPFAISFILTLLMRVANWSWIEKFYKEYIHANQNMSYDTTGAVMLSLLQTYLFFIAFYSFLMLMQTLMANNIAASIIGCIVLVVPWFILEGGSATLSNILQRNVRMYGNNRWSSLYNLMFIRRISHTSPSSMGGNIVTYEHYGIEMIVLLLIAVLSVYIGIWFYGKNDNSRNGQLAMFPWIGNILVLGVTVCSGILGNNILRSVVRQSNSIYEIATLAISGMIGYIIIRKIIQVTGRCEV